MEAVALGHVRLSIRTTALRVAASWAAIATGMSIGREGPLIEFGGSLGASLGRITRCSREQIRVLVAAGTAAGFASAYNTPFAAVLFVVETVVGIAAPVAVVPAIAATVIASAITRALAGGGPIYGQRSFALESALDWLVLAGVAILAAIAAHFFKRALLAAENLFERRLWGQPWRAAIGGLIVGTVALVVPMVAGNGFEPLNLTLDGRLMAASLIALLGAKWLTTSASVASGVPGGVFTPVLLTGGIVGALIAHLVSSLWPQLATPAGSLALIGMAAAIAASIRAPLTAAVLVFELSGDYAIVLPLLFVTTIATGLTRIMGGESIYESELKRRGLGWELTLEGRRTRHLDAAAGVRPRRL
jgi:CIC family chloride channel protein